MARLNQGPNGPFSGKVGSVIGSSWRGIYYIKGLQKKTTKPRSPLQIEQQQKFTFAVKFLGPVKPVLDMGFSHINPGGATGYNMAISHFIQNAIKGTYPALEIDYPSVVFTTKGKLALPETVTMESDDSDLELKWSTGSGPRAYIDDQVGILIFYPGLSTHQAFTDGIARKQGEINIALPTWYDGAGAHVYMYLTSRDRKMWSDSLYVGSIGQK